MKSFLIKQVFVISRFILQETPKDAHEAKLKWSQMKIYKSYLKLRTRLSTGTITFASVRQGNWPSEIPLTEVQGSRWLKVGHQSLRGFPDGWAGKESTCNTGDMGDTSSIPGLGRSAGGRNGNPPLCSCLENPVDRGDWQATIQRVSKGWTERLSKHISPWESYLYWQFTLTPKTEAAHSLNSAKFSETADVLRKKSDPNHHAYLSKSQLLPQTWPSIPC